MIDKHVNKFLFSKNKRRRIISMRRRLFYLLVAKRLNMLYNNIRNKT